MSYHYFHLSFSKELKGTLEVKLCECSKSRQSYIRVQGAEHHLFESSYNLAETEAQQGGAATLFHQTHTQLHSS